MKLCRKIILIITLSSIINVCDSQTIELEKVKSEQNLRNTIKIIETLSSDEFRGRDISDKKSIEKTKFYIENILKALKINPLKGKGYRQKFFISHEIHSENIIGHIPGKDLTKNILVYANYDNLGVKKDYFSHSDDSIFNGANDNAVGCAAVIQIANSFKDKKPEIGLIIAFISAKHFSQIGSGSLGGYLKDNNYNLTLAIDIEMIGRYRNKVHVSNPEMSDFISKANSLLGKTYFEAYRDDEMFHTEAYRDDEVFYNMFNIPSHTVSTFDYSDELYMSTKDEFEQLDLNFVHNTINNLTVLINRLCNGHSCIFLK